MGKISKGRRTGWYHKEVTKILKNYERYNAETMLHDYNFVTKGEFFQDLKNAEFSQYKIKFNKYINVNPYIAL